MLREAQGSAVARRSDTDWGVRMWNSVSGAVASCGSISPPTGCSGSASCAELFSGSSYAAASVQRRVAIPSTVDFSSPAEGQCADVLFAERSGRRLSEGQARISYYDATAGNLSLKTAQFAGAGGTGGCNSAWNCLTIDADAADDGQYTAIAFSPSGNPWVSYYDATASALMVAQYVGAGGTGCGGSPSPPVDWTCEIVDNTGTITGQYTSLAFDSSGNPWVGYYDTGSTALRVATRGGTWSPGACTDTDWQCGTVDNTATDTGRYSSLAFDFSGNPGVSYYDATAGNLRLLVAQFVGGGGTGCSTSAWNCEIVDDTGTDTGQYTGLAFDLQGRPWVSYYDATNSALRVATRGGGFGTVCTDSDWTCAAVANTDDDGKFSSLAFSPSGSLWVSYYQDGALDRLRAANYTGGSSGNCTNTAWACEIVEDTAGIVGQYTSVAIDSSGIPWVSYYDSTNSSLRVATRGSSVWSPPGCTGTDAGWICDVVDNTATATGQYTDLIFDPVVRVMLFRAAQANQTKIIGVNTQGNVSVQ